ncbi:MAG: septum formation protein Maf [Candidatus Krumholzibacteriota bacterium]|nr:septum formation protein Maf [Candidatus Krumholzibacteriota bacterium]
MSARAQAGLVLASASPRRRELLAGLGFACEVLPSAYREENGEGAPEAAARRHALGKAREVARRRPGALVIGADTLVVADGRSLGKPADADAARAMLRALAGRAHEVMTAVALARWDPAPGRLREAADLSRTVVRFRDLAAAEIEAYLATGEPFDKAGAYGIQGHAAQFVTGIEGCYFNVMGLPLELLTRMLRDWERGPARGGTA